MPLIKARPKRIRTWLSWRTGVGITSCLKPACQAFSHTPGSLERSHLGRVVALKMIAAGQLASPDAVTRFHMEARSVANLDHPNIVPIYEIGECEGQHYFTMRLFERGTLAQAIQDGKSKIGAGATPFDASSFLHSRLAVAELLVRVSRAVHYAHQRGILHRDLKPGNILLDANDQPHVTDFGLAKALEGECDLTETAAVVGTASYMSPEQASGRAQQLATASDAFSLGTILYELLVGCPPFQGATPLQTLRRVVEEEPKKPRSLNPGIDRWS
jgi:eukaryotic-like serine/threonine-protein kinase